jgi:hypothetical protein
MSEGTVRQEEQLYLRRRVANAVLRGLLLVLAAAIFAASNA